MKESFYQFYEEKANHCEKLPKSSSVALQHCPGNFSATLPRSTKAIILRTVHRNVQSFATGCPVPMRGSKIPRSGRWCEENSNKAGRQRSSPAGLRIGIRNFLQAMRPSTNGSIVMSADGSRHLFGRIAEGSPGAIPIITAGSTFPRGYRSRNGQNQSGQDATSATGRPTP